MAKINWTNPRGLSRDDLIAAAEARKQAEEENAARIAQYGRRWKKHLRPNMHKKQRDRLMRIEEWLNYTYLRYKLITCKEVKNGLLGQK